MFTANWKDEPERKMTIRLLKNDEEIYILELSGNLDLYSSNQLKEHVMKLIEKRIKGAIIDLRWVDLINSAGIGSLIFISSTFKNLNYALAITNINARIRKTMDITRLTGYLPIAASLREAVDKINSAAQ